MGGQNHTFRKTAPLRLAVAKSPRLIATIDAIETVTHWDRADTPTQNFLYQLKAAQSLEIFQPFSPEEQALSDYLSARMAGRRLCEYAWRTYAQAL
jgi:hypothetical protein